MADKFKLILGEDFFFEGSVYDFGKTVRRELSRRDNSLSSEELDEAEHYAEYIFDRLIEPTNREEWGATPIEKLRLSLNNNEFIKTELLEQKRSSNDTAMYLLISEYKYYINLRSATLTLIALILDIVATNGIASTVLALLGINNRALAHIPSQNGERCVLIETCRQKEQTASNEIFKNIKESDCVNNNLLCKYRKNGICTITDSDIDNLFDMLVEKNVFSKINGQFKYNL